jgi:hypothetical protein
MFTTWPLPSSRTLMTAYEEGKPPCCSKTTTFPVLPPCHPLRILTIASSKFSVDMFFFLSVESYTTLVTANETRITWKERSGSKALSSYPAPCRTAGARRSSCRCGTSRRLRYTGDTSFCASTRRDASANAPALVDALPTRNVLSGAPMTPEWPSLSLPRPSRVASLRSTGTTEPATGPAHRRLTSPGLSSTFPKLLHAHPAAHPAGHRTGLIIFPDFGDDGFGREHQAGD